MDVATVEALENDLKARLPDAPPASIKALIECAMAEHEAEGLDVVGAPGETNANFLMLLLAVQDLENNPKATIEQLEAANAAVRHKADAIKIRLTQLESEEKRLAQLQQEFGAAKAVMARKKERLNEWARHCLLSTKRDKVLGDKFEMQVIERDGGVIGAENLVVDGRFRMRYPNYVNASYSLKLQEIASAIKSGATDLPPGLAIGKTHSFQIKVRKGTK